MKIKTSSSLIWPGCVRNVGSKAVLTATLPTIARSAVKRKTTSSWTPPARSVRSEAVSTARISPTAPCVTSPTTSMPTTTGATIAEDSGGEMLCSVRTSSLTSSAESFCSVYLLSFCVSVLLYRSRIQMAKTETETLELSWCGTDWRKQKTRRIWGQAMRSWSFSPWILNVIIFISLCQIHQTKLRITNIGYNIGISI